MSNILQWAAIFGSLVVIVAYSAFRDHRDIAGEKSKARREAAERAAQMQAEDSQQAHLEFSEPETDREMVMTGTHG